MTIAECLILAAAAAAIGAALACCREADRLRRRVQALEAKADALEASLRRLVHTTRPETAEERVGILRGAIAAAASMEQTLKHHALEFPERMVLTAAKADAARAREMLRGLGVEL